MRAPIALAAIAGLGLLSVGIITLGAPLAESSTQIEVDDFSDSDLPIVTDDGPTDEAPVDALAEETPAEAPADEALIEPSGNASDLARDEPEQTSPLERIAPRPPLSELAVPQQPKPPKAIPPDRWKPSRLFNPVATAAGLVEAKGYRVALAGLTPFAPDEMCSFEGKEWACGARARTAFRSWLRTRAVLCSLPPDPDREIIVAECRVGNEDPAQWLVASGWAKASAGGPYVELGQQAQASGKGMFGAPPSPLAAPAPLRLPDAEPLPETDPAEITAPGGSEPSAPAGADLPAVTPGFPPAPSQ